MSNWYDELQQLCDEFDIPSEYLTAIIDDPKVMPMIRGKAFEFRIMVLLQKSLPQDVWEVSKPFMNAQAGIHDVDVLVTHKPSRKFIRIECKLASKGSLRIPPGGNPNAKVKCMRSRTLGDEMVRQRAAELGISVSKLSSHRDNYVPDEFDFVFSSLSNSLFDTDPATGRYRWAGSAEDKKFLRAWIGSRSMSEVEASFQYVFFAKSGDLTPKGRGTSCTRRTCGSPKTCEFIPNYPEISFSSATKKPTKPWNGIEDVEKVFSAFLGLPPSATGVPGRS